MSSAPARAAVPGAGVAIKKRKQSKAAAAAAAAAAEAAAAASVAAQAQAAAALPARCAGDGAVALVQHVPYNGVDMAGYPMPAPGAAPFHDDLPTDASEDRRLMSLLETTCREERNNVSLAFAGTAPAAAPAVAEALDEFLLQAEELLLRRRVAVGRNSGGALEGRLEAHKAQLRAALAQFKEEEAAWTRLVEQQEHLATGAAEQQQQVRAAEVAAAGAVDDAAEGIPEKGTLPAAVGDAERAIAAQADALTQMVNQAEAAADNADERAKELAVQMSKNAFAPFVHVDSPNVLIRNLVKRATS